MKSALHEVAWLAACYGLSLLATGALLGFRALLPWRTLDIQTHNTWFILPNWLLPLPLLLVAATPLTLVRAAQQGFRPRSSRAVLGALGVAWLLLIALIIRLATALNPNSVPVLYSR